MEDATGQMICRHDLVMFKSTNRGRALKSLPGGKVVVQCIDGAEATEQAGDVTVVDRSYLYPGMLVLSASDRGGQIGVVTAAARTLDLMVQLDGGGQAVARGVSPAEVRRVRELCLGDYVMSGHWLGRVFELSLDVDVLFDGGAAVCRVTQADSKLTAVKRDCLNRHTNSCFYPGQHVVSGGGVFKASRWLKGYWKPSYVQGTVSKVKIAGVLVHWVASSSKPVSVHLVQPPPSADQLPDNLTFFCRGDELCFWTVGDRCFFRNPCCSSSSNAGNVVAPLARTTRRRNRLMRTGIKRRSVAFERPMSVADTHTTVDVLWQDGSRQRGVPSVSLIADCTAKNEHDFLPGERVVLAPPVAADNDARVGVVRSFSSKDQTVHVAWFKGDTRRNEFDYDETLSAYDLVGENSDEYGAFYGDIVVRRQTMGEEPAVPRHQCKQKKKNITDNDDLSWAGHIVDLCDDGHIQVKWGDGSTSKVLLHEISVVKQPGVDEMLQEIGSWVHDDGDLSDEDIVQATPAATDMKNVADSAPARTTTGRVGTIVQAVLRLTRKALAQGRRYCLASGPAMAEASSSEVAATEKEEASCAAAGRNDDDGSVGVGEEKSKADATGGSNKSFHFPQFDVVQSPSDHHYLDSMEQGTCMWTKRVHKEWKILKNDLPGTVYVRVFEDRMDLLRVAMVGACGTPYHDGLFFFDLQLPPSYPATPPLVSYRSFGLRVNPNLYESGTVCLSLLNTFGGNGTEVWLPESSTVLQVLVSIQGLVLTAQPYYNEPVYASHMGTPVGHRNELPYSENTYLLTLQTMLHLLRRRPAGFEDLVRDHFRRRGRHILRACEAYLEGSLVGTLDGEGNATEASTVRPCSAGFRLPLANIMPRLYEELINIGAQGCEQFNRPSHI